MVSERAAMIVLSVLGLAPALGFAEPCDRFVVEQTPAQDAEGFAGTVHELAAEASSAGCLDQADRLLEGAHHANPNALHIYARILVREQMGDVRFALELLDGYRDELAAHPDAHDLVALDRRLREKLHGSPPLDGPAPVTATPRRTGLHTIGPIVTGLLGLSAVGGAVYGLTAKCTHEAVDGRCLEGTETAVAPTLTYAVLGVAALSGAVLWWVWTSPTDQSQVLLSPIAVHARF